LSLIVGWWGIPWDPIYTIGSVYKNLTGGIDVTGDVLNSWNQQTIEAAPVAAIIR
jgi:hypothetical protein